MPSNEQSITLSHTDNASALALAYETMKRLGWDIAMATGNTLTANTPKNWKRKSQHLTCTVENGMLSIRSEMVHGEVVDIGGLNKKNTTAFINTYQELLASAGTINISENNHVLDILRGQTRETIAQQQRDHEELNAALNLEGSNLYVTYAIIGINLLVFILMALDGAGIVDANSIVHIKWGSNYTALTLSGDWWRLVSNMFIHFGIIHVLMNMYCLYTVGIYLEPMLGKLKYGTAYLCTGIIASLVSLWWHTDTVNSAGASGAVFGMYGVFLALLTSNLIPKAARQSLLQSIGIFVVYNLVYGMKSGVDNAAHVGGLVSGFIFGYLYVFGIKKEKQDEQKIKWIIPVLLLLTAGSAFGYLQQHKVSADERTVILNELKVADYKDNARFNEKLDEFDAIHKSINEVLSDTTITNPQLLEKIDGLNDQWKKAAALITATNNYDIAPASHARAQKLLQYIALRQEELPLLKQMAETNNNDLMPQFNETRTKANALFEELAGK